MKKPCIVPTVFGLALLAAALSPSARGGDDWEWWVDLPVSAPLTRGLSLEAIGSLKFKDDMNYLYNRGITAGPYFRAAPWLCLGFDYWYREVRRTSSKPWDEHNTLATRVNLNWKASERLRLQLHNRLEYDADTYLWRLRLRPRLLIPLVLGAVPITAVVDDEFFFYLDYPRNRDAFSENRFSVGLRADPTPFIRLQLAYKRVETRPGDEWTGSNVLATCVKIKI